jgi:hypothetical protein
MIITTLGAKVKAGGKMLHGFFKASQKNPHPRSLSRNRKTGDFWTGMPAKGVKAPLSSFAWSSQNWRGAGGEDFSWRPAEYVYRVKTINFEKPSKILAADLRSGSGVFIFHYFLHLPFVCFVFSWFHSFSRGRVPNISSIRSK